MIIDSFMFFNEFDILEMRLMELGDVVDHFIIVEADVDHQDHPKPYHLSDYIANGGERFNRWVDKMAIVRATDLPTAAEFPDSWAREHAQRECIAAGLADINAAANDTLMQSDVDEIPRAIVVRNLRPGGRLIVIGMRGHFWAVDWFYPIKWCGTVVGTVATVMASHPRMPFTHMRDVRTTAHCPIPDGGWHFSWLGGPELAAEKLGAFCHPEVADRISAGISDGLSFWRDGVHSDGVKMEPIDIDAGWPEFITAGHCPDTWFRPRKATT